MTRKAQIRRLVRALRGTGLPLPDRAKIAKVCVSHNADAGLGSFCGWEYSQCSQAFRERVKLYVQRGLQVEPSDDPEWDVVGIGGPKATVLVSRPRPSDEVVQVQPN